MRASMLASARDGEGVIERGGYTYLLPLISLDFNFKLRMVLRPSGIVLHKIN